MWRMAIVGLPEFIAYCLANPGRSRFELSCQGSELMIGMIKYYFVKNVELVKIICQI